MVIHVEPAGSLRALLGESVNQITDLTLTGNLNGTDLKVTREMPYLSILNLADANIVEGGEYYYYYGELEINAIEWFEFHTSNNELGTYAFYNLNMLTSVIVPNSVTTIRNFVFYMCPNLTSVTIGSRVTAIGDFVFSASDKLKTITIPDNVTTIGDYTFVACKGLTNVEIGNGVTSIGTRTFQSCPNLSSVTLGSNIKSIGEGAFLNCTRLANIYLRNPTPPTVGTNCFLNLPPTCNIHVPSTSIQAYRSAPGWGIFDPGRIPNDPAPLLADIKVYPSPFTSELHLTDADGFTLQVVSATGAVVYTKKNVPANETLSLGNIPAGVYFFRFEKEGKVKTVKAVKK
jgi:hypothetical protein